MTYSLNPNNILTPEFRIVHRDEEYDPAGFEVLLDMQSRHFWYQGRHRFVLRALQRHLPRPQSPEQRLTAIDLGGGCGGWVSYLQKRMPGVFAELALSDSSLRALELAGPVVGAAVSRYHVDLLQLGWQNRWDVAFLLDVLEHIPDDADVLRQIKAALKPGGVLLVAAPALQRFWSYNDDLAHHVRRYSRDDLARLAETSGLLLRQSRYFMFFLSPLLWLSRLQRPNLTTMSRIEISELKARTHRVPIAPVNGLLRLIFSLETPLGLRFPFPWGTSILGVFQKPV